MRDYFRAGRLSITKTEENEKPARDLLNMDRHSSVRIIADTLGVDKMVVYQIIFGDFGKR